MNNLQIINTLGLLSTLIVLPFHYIIQIRFFNNFLDFENKIWKCIFFVISLLFLNILTYKIQFPSPLTFIINDLLCFIFLYYLYPGNFVLKLYASIVPTTILLLTYTIFLNFDYYVSSCIYNLNMSSILNISVLFLINITRESLNLIILFILLKKINKFLNFKEKIVDAYQSLYLFVPCFATYSLILIFYFTQYIHVDNKSYYLFSIFPKIYFVVPFVCIILLISILINAYIFKKVIEIQEIEQTNLLMEQQFKLQINHSKNLEALYSSIRSVKHDINNHLLCLKILAENGNTKEINKYLYTLGQTIKN
nr:TPA_exp: hypothetical protein CAETHG_RS04805_1 [Clostridium autoethanogenum DSM 10061]